MPEPVGEPDESFIVELSTECCAEVTTGISTVTIKEECNGPRSKCNCFLKMQYVCNLSKLHSDVHGLKKTAT